MNRAESLYEKVKIAQVSLECGGLTPLSFRSYSLRSEQAKKRRQAGALQNQCQSVRPQRPQNFVPEG